MTHTQIKHLLYKEWIKTRWYAAVGLVVSLALSVYTCINAVSMLHDLGGALLLLDPADGQYRPHDSAQIPAFGNSSAHRLAPVPARDYQQAHTPHPAPARGLYGRCLHHGALWPCRLLLHPAAGPAHHGHHTGSQLPGRGDRRHLADPAALVAWRYDRLFLHGDDSL